MAVPKRRTSKQRRNSRRANWKLSLPGIVECPECHQMMLSHRVCKHCGYYRKKQIVNVEKQKANS
ncbi:50S ribosomal protein L32 [Gehongia tenuis]|jgi:large subunit ribosomal protein L32|uniref:Large ribosomal subunit protein bL32 n=1 Tax=Gehongia tenuis TaxID=2763655 RepID=A0A926HKG9_9FIRM|nr:50S ribosomal protein L32 [Gehongia tenuis]MBC8530972.1 50S ribosomal protein L32 [Gehongia tenuis]